MTIFNDTDTEQAVDLYWRLKHDIERVTNAIEQAGQIDWLGAGSVVPHLEAAAQSLSVALARLETAAARKYGKEDWDAYSMGEDALNEEGT